MSVSPIKADCVRYIKLGRGGLWENECLNEGIVRLGYHTEKYFDLCATKKWDELAVEYKEECSTSGVATGITNLVRYFFEDNGKTLWITFHGRKMWWAFIDPSISAKKHGDKHGVYRKTQNGWSSTDVAGTQLHMDNLSGNLTKVAGFQGTICEVKEPELALRKINAERTPAVVKAEKLCTELGAAIVNMMRLLTPKDFELLVDLIFSASGWRRSSIVGGREKTIDMELTLPTTGERAFVQVKSATNQNEFDEYREAFNSMNQFDRMFFVYHTCPDGKLKGNTKGVIIVDPNRLAEMVMDAGLTSWLIRKVS